MNERQLIHPPCALQCHMRRPAQRSPHLQPRQPLPVLWREPKVLGALSDQRQVALRWERRAALQVNKENR